MELEARAVKISNTFRPDRKESGGTGLHGNPVRARA